MSSETKKKRSPNFTESEIELFVEVLLPKYKSVIENKKTDALTRGEKAAAWSRLQVDFNNLSSIFHRTEENLRNLWGELKKKARKSQAFQKRETVCTGGGERNKSGDPTKLDDKVLEVIGPSGVGLNEQYGGDAEIPETDSSSATDAN
ncbi:uncharacterized protein LOC117652010 [Thrips palmi]|uniref:Regulatory protein zeste n=1 Tax=Thrips palmi TaxID=161013 RepID=A0A6P9A8A0_THRPL|nr:uncharacterized protein LOC117652010 [Thrips palmi]